MSRPLAAVALAAVLAAPAAAMDAEAECAALLARVGATAGSTATPGGACFFRDVAWGEGEAAWRARTLAVYGDLDAIPDAPPHRLTGGAWGVTRGEAAGEGDDAPPGVDLTFDVASGGGAVRVDRIGLRLGDAVDATLSARLEGMPPVWPAEPRAAARMRLVSLDLSLALDGWPEGAGAVPWLDALADAAPADAADALRAMAAAPRGTLDLLVEQGEVPLREALRLLAGGATPGAVARLLALAGPSVEWAPEP